MSVLHALCLAQYPAKSARFLHQTSQETSYSYTGQASLLNLLATRLVSVCPVGSLTLTISSS